ncbi:MAG: carboxynorspermidine decarboxylase [Desulfobacterales bacterium]
MDRNYLERLKPDCRLPSPCFVVDESIIKKNLGILNVIRKKTGAKILLALKAFAMFSLFPLIRHGLDGTCASGLHEARLGYEKFGKEVHVFSPAYSDSEMEAIVKYADHVIFNSFNQYRRFHRLITDTAKNIRMGIRINPEHSEGTVPMYDPCSPGSRLGVRPEHFEPESLDDITGLHFHTLCEQNADALDRTLKIVEQKFGTVLHRMKWLNMGGGHHITRHDYDFDLLCRNIDRIQKHYQVQVYLEPGEAVALNAGILVSTVLDIVSADIPVAILDTSATCHMPDVLEMPYRPQIIGSDYAGKKSYTFRLGGKSCLAGDIIGEYSFDNPLKIGDRLAFLDMAIYSMVKTTTFNGVNLPAIASYHPESNKLTIIRQFGYEDYKTRLS